MPDYSTRCCRKYMVTSWPSKRAVRMRQMPYSGSVFRRNSLQERRISQSRLTGVRGCAAVASRFGDKLSAWEYLRYVARLSVPKYSWKHFARKLSVEWGPIVWMRYFWVNSPYLIDWNGFSLILSWISDARRDPTLEDGRIHESRESQKNHNTHERFIRSLGQTLELS